MVIVYVLGGGGTVSLKVGLPPVLVGVLHNIFKFCTEIQMIPSIA